MKTMMILAALATLAFAVKGRAETPAEPAAKSAATATSPSQAAASTTQANSTTSANSAGLATTQLTDQQIAGIMKEANNAEIDAAKIATHRAKDAQVKDFAKHMMTEHTKNNKMAKDVEKRVNLSPIASNNSKTLQRDATNQGSNLKKASATTFDRTYIDQQIAMHSQLLKDLDGTYIPQTQNAEMKAFLEQTRMHVQKHLEMAQQIQAKLGGGSAAPTVQQ